VGKGIILLKEYSYRIRKKQICWFNEERCPPVKA